MYKIIFLDDEAMTLKLLERAIDWQRHGIELCGSAGDGEEGIALFRQVDPDIVITDIRMPRMNGIELAAAIRQSRKQVKILLLSAYAEFEYAHSAITYEISEYLLKPLDEDKLEAAIARVVQELDRAGAVNSTMASYRLEQAEKQLQQQFSGSPISPGSPAGARRDVREPLPAALAAACERADTLIDCVRVIEPHELQLRGDGEAIRLLLKERLGPTTAVAAVSSVELIVLAGGLRPGQLEEALDELRRQGRPVMAGIGSLARPPDLIAAHWEAEEALAACFYAGQGLCRAPVAAPDIGEDIPGGLPAFEQPIAALVEQGQADDLIDGIQARLAELLRLRVEPALIRDFVFDILNWVRIELARQHRTAAVAAMETISRERLRACAHGPALAAYLAHLLRTVGASVSSSLAEDPGYYIVREAKEYTRRRYSEPDFSLQDVALHVGLSKNHFSQVFHKVTGQKFWDYVTQLRIEKAKELLKQSNCSNYEICRAIGYESEFYFSKVFKRVTGMAAQQYRKL